MESARGLTWEHPRGTQALRMLAGRARDRGELDLTWDAQPLAGFESAPIGSLARDHDVLVLDHPHLGAAIRQDALWPLEELYGEDRLDGWAAASVGPSQRAYVLDGKTWALPLDAATQVAVRRRDLAPEAPPTWADVVAAAGGGRVALCLAGPHALLTFSSLCVALGEEPAGAADRYVTQETGLRALGILARLAEHAPAGTASLDPIGLLERMSASDDIAYCPLVYGYVNYALTGHGTALTFSDAPAAAPGGRHGSTLGGTGVAFSTRSRPSPRLLAHVGSLLAEETQRTAIPGQAGQPSARSAWEDGEIDARSNGFYRGTRATIEDAWVRPRYDGYIAFQSEASRLLRAALLEHRGRHRTLAELDAAYRTSRRTAPRQARQEREPAA